MLSLHTSTVGLDLATAQGATNAYKEPLVAPSQQNSALLCLYSAGRGRMNGRETWQCPAALFTPRSCCSTMAGDRLSSEKFSLVLWSWAPFIFSQKSLFLLWSGFGLFWWDFLGDGEGDYVWVFFGVRQHAWSALRVLLYQNPSRSPCWALTSPLNTAENPEPKMPGELPASNDQKLNYSPRPPALPARGKPLPRHATDFHLFWGSKQHTQQKARAGIKIKIKKNSYYSARLAPTKSISLIFFLFTTRALLVTRLIMILLMNIISCTCTLNKVDRARNCCSFQNTSKNKYSTAIRDLYIWMIFFPALLKDKLLQSHTASSHMKKSTWILEDSDFVPDLIVRQNHGSSLVTPLGL